MSITSKQVKPVFGVNYDIGFVGFTHTDSSFVSSGITWFTRWDRMSEIAVSHVLLVTGADKCIEANPEGVVQSNLSDRFNDPKIQIFFRKPRGWNSAMGKRLVAAAQKYIGNKYDYGLIVANFLTSNLIGRGLNSLFGGMPAKWLFKVFDRKNAQICDEVIALILQTESGLKMLGVLRKPAREINPQMLFEDDGCFEIWKRTEPKS